MSFNVRQGEVEGLEGGGAAFDMAFLDVFGMVFAGFGHVSSGFRLVLGLSEDFKSAYERQGWSWQGTISEWEWLHVIRVVLAEDLSDDAAFTAPQTGCSHRLRPHFGLILADFG